MGAVVGDVVVHEEDGVAWRSRLAGLAGKKNLDEGKATVS